MKLNKDEIRPIAFGKLSFPAICVSALVLHAIMCAAVNPSMKMKKTVEISNHEESEYAPNVASTSDRKFEGKMHTFLFNGRLEKLCEIWTGSEIVYFGAPCQFYVYSEGVVSGISHFHQQFISFQPSLHRDHEIVKHSEAGVAIVGRQNVPILCSGWDEFAERATGAGYFFPREHFFLRTMNNVALPKSLTGANVEFSGGLFDGVIESAYTKGKSLFIELNGYAGALKIRMELSVRNSSEFTLVRAWRNNVPVNLKAGPKGWRRGDPPWLDESVRHLFKEQ